MLYKSKLKLKGLFNPKVFGICMILYGINDVSDHNCANSFTKLSEYGIRCTVGIICLESGNLIM